MLILRWPDWNLNKNYFLKTENLCKTCQPTPNTTWNWPTEPDFVIFKNIFHFTAYLRVDWRWERDFPDFSSVFFVSSSMELQEEVKRGGLYWLREVLELLWWEVREGWNIDREWVKETLALFLNTAIPLSLFSILLMLVACWWPDVWSHLLRTEGLEASHSFSHQRLTGSKRRSEQPSLLFNHTTLARLWTRASHKGVYLLQNWFSSGRRS